MVRVKDFLRNVGNRLRKFGQTVYDFTRTRIVPGIVNAYNRGRRFVGRLGRFIEAGSDATGHIADAVGGEAGNRIRQGKEKFDQKYGQVKDKIGEIHKKGEDIYNRGRRIYETGRNAYERVRQQMKA